MNKAIIILVALVSSLTLRADERPITLEELPSNARSFLNSHFQDEDISFITFDRELFDSEYHVILVNGTKIDFDTKGNWESVDCRNSSVPSEIVPNYVVEEIKLRFPNKNYEVLEISRDRKGVEVKITNGMELDFNKNGQLVEIDS